MKENMLDVLFYLFDNYPSMEDQVEEDRETLHHYLQDAGFHYGEIIKAFDWLESLGDEAADVAPTVRPGAFRVFSTYEKRWLDTACQNHLMLLEQSGALTPEAREQVIDRVMELQDEDFDLSRLKWVILMVLGNQADQNHSLFWLDDTMLSDGMTVLH